MDKQSGLKNSHGGKTYKKSKTRRVRNDPSVKVVVNDNDDVVYGKVDGFLGSNRILVVLENGNKVQARIPGKYWKKVWIKLGFFVQLSNDYEVLRIVKDEDKDFKKAREKIEKATGEDTFFEFAEDEEEDVDDVLQHMDGNKKTKEALIRREKEKQRDLERRKTKDEREYSTPETIENIEKNERNERKEIKENHDSSNSDVSSDETDTMRQVD